MSAPESFADSDNVSSAQVPQLIAGLLEGGWDVSVAGGEPDNSDDDAAVGDGDDGEPEILDVDVLGYPGGARIGLIVNTEEITLATAVGASLGEHLSNAAPALLGWNVASLVAERRSGPRPSGRWFDEKPAAGPRFSPSEHLSPGLQELCAQYLIAAAVRYLHNPVTGSPHAVDATDLVAGTLAGYPWHREIPGAMGGLLVAAARFEAGYGERGTLVGRGEGGPAVTADLLTAVRDDCDHPATGYDDDRMRGHVVLERFAEECQLVWNRVDPDLDREVSDARNDERLRVLLWAGLRALATMTQGLADTARTPWMWLAALDSEDVDDVVDVLAERDYDELQQADEDAADQTHRAAKAHLLIRIALLHPGLLTDSAKDDLLRHLGDREVANGPLIQLLADTLPALGTAAVRSAATGSREPTVREAARNLAAILQRIEQHEVGAYDDLYGVLEELLPGGADHRYEQVAVMLNLIREAGVAAGGDRSSETAASLFRHPGELACVIVDAPDIDQDIRRHVIAEACFITPRLAGDIAAHLPELTSDDPLDEPALRDEAMTWWKQLVTAARHPNVVSAINSTVARCPEPGAALLRTLPRTPGDGSTPPPSGSTRDLAVGVAQAVSALTLTTSAPDLPFDVIA